MTDTKTRLDEIEARHNASMTGIVGQSVAGYTDAEMEWLDYTHDAVPWLITVIRHLTATEPDDDTEPEATCKTCDTPWGEHLGIVGTCAALRDALAMVACERGRGDVLEAALGSCERALDLTHTEIETTMGEMREWRALGTALRTQESRVSGLLADAGVVTGLVEGVVALVEERDRERDAHAVTAGKLLAAQMALL